MFLPESRKVSFLQSVAVALLTTLLSFGVGLLQASAAQVSPELPRSIPVVERAALVAMLAATLIRSDPGAQKG